MFAWRVHEYGHYREVLRAEDDLDDPAVPSEGVVVRVGAAGLNFPDLLAVAGKYQVRAPLPFVPGIEAAGTVIAAGPRSVHTVGERVAVTNLMGAFADKMVVPDSGAFSIPDAMTDAHGAALLITYQTAYFALVHRARVAASQWVLVHGGAGGVGTATIQVAKALGARVIATASTDEKRVLCTQCGADEVAPSDDFIGTTKRVTAGRGANVIVDPVGGDVFDASTKCIAHGGSLVTIGFAAGRIPSIQANRILLKNIGILGLNWGSYLTLDHALVSKTHAALCALYEAGDIAPVIHDELPLRALPDAMDAIERRQVRGKLVLIP